jgi:hypothetical protein
LDAANRIDGSWVPDARANLAGSQEAVDAESADRASPVGYVH